MWGLCRWRASQCLAASTESSGLVSGHECFEGVSGELSINHCAKSEERLASFPIERFRINIILESAGSLRLDPWEEDGFKRLEAFPASQASDAPYGQDALGKGIGIHVNAKCGRCLVPSVDLNTVSDDGDCQCSRGTGR